MEGRLGAQLQSMVQRQEAGAQHVLELVRQLLNGMHDETSV